MQGNTTSRSKPRRRGRKVSIATLTALIALAAGLQIFAPAQAGAMAQGTEFNPCHNGGTFDPQTGKCDVPGGSYYPGEVIPVSGNVWGQGQLTASTRQGVDRTTLRDLLNDGKGPLWDKQQRGAVKNEVRKKTPDEQAMVCVDAGRRVDRIKNDILARLPQPFFFPYVKEGPGPDPVIAIPPALSGSKGKEDVRLSIGEIEPLRKYINALGLGLLTRQEAAKQFPKATFSRLPRLTAAYEEAMKECQDLMWGSDGHRRTDEPGPRWYFDPETLKP